MSKLLQIRTERERRFKVRPFRCFFILVIVFSICPNLSADAPLSGFITASTSRDNAVILDLLISSELDDAISYGRLLFLREDPYVGDIITGLWNVHYGSSSGRTEAVLRAIIESMFFDELGYPREKMRKTNEEALIILQDDMAECNDSGLKAALILLLPAHLSGGALKILLREGLHCIDLAEENGGYFPGDTSLEVRAFLLSAAGSDTSQAYAQIRRIYELSAVEEITSLAKKCLEEMDASGVR